MPVEDVRTLCREIIYDIFIHMQAIPHWAEQRMVEDYQQDVGFSRFNLRPTRMKNQDLGMLASQLLLWPEFFGQFIEFEMQCLRRLPNNRYEHPGVGYLHLSRFSGVH